MSAYSVASGDVVEVLKGFDDNSFDALMCDAPYGFSFMGKKWDYDVPSVALWRECLRVLKPGAPLVTFAGARTYHRMACNIEDAGFEIRDCLMWLYAKGFPKSQNIGLAIDKAAGAPSTALAKAWDGYGTAMKPAYEPIAFARKPLDGTMASNVAAWGVGGLAIDACRIGERWPANLLLDDEAAALLDAEVGDRPSTPFRENVAAGNVLPFTKRTAGGYSDGGGASRFFYCAKVSTKEREAGCDHLPRRSAGEMTDSNEDDARLDSPRTGAGRGGGARNHHPTLKPLSLNTWLARLILPPLLPGALPPVLLVPFAGSGSEMIGALRAGWGCVFGIEREAEYVQIAQARLAHWCPESEAA